MIYIKNKKGRLIILFLTVIVILFWAFNIGLFLYKDFEKAFLYPQKYSEEVAEYSQKYTLNKNLIYSVIKTESSFNKNSISKQNAIGLMQIKENTARFIGEMLQKNSYDLKDPKTNIEFGCFYLRYLLNKFENLDSALVAYNAGEGNVYLWLNNKEYSKDGKTLDVIPYEESKEYLNKIKKTFEKYNKLY